MQYYDFIGAAQGQGYSPLVQSVSYLVSLYESRTKAVGSRTSGKLSASQRARSEPSLYPVGRKKPEVHTAYNSVHKSRVPTMERKSEQDDSDNDDYPQMTSLYSIKPNLEPMEVKRREVIKEILETERTHVKCLRALDRLFRQPMLRQQDVVAGLARKLFPRLQELMTWHGAFVTAIRDSVNTDGRQPEVGCVLYNLFEGTSGEKLGQISLEFIKDQQFALEDLNILVKTDKKLQEFIQQIELNPRCQRRQLKDMLACQMQRLTKYHLLISTLIKYTQSSTDESKYLECAVQRCKEIVALVNSQLPDLTSFTKLREIKNRLERRDIDAGNVPELSHIKTLDLVRENLTHDGHMTWIRHTHQPLELLALLMGDKMVLLQVYRDKYLLKCHQDIVNGLKTLYYPVLVAEKLLAKVSAADKTTFFLVYMSQLRPLLFELKTESQQSRDRWCGLINEQSEKMKLKKSFNTKQKTSDMDLDVIDGPYDVTDGLMDDSDGLMDDSDELMQATDMLDQMFNYPLPKTDSPLQSLLASHTQATELQTAMKHCLQILSQVNLDPTCGTHTQKVKVIQDQMIHFQVELMADPALTLIQSLQATDLVFEGSLTWSLVSGHPVELWVMLFQDRLVLLHTEEGGYVLKSHVSGEQVIHPVLERNHLFAQTLASDSTSFFVVSTSGRSEVSERSPQLFEFSAPSTELCQKWCQLINNTSVEEVTTQLWYQEVVQDSDEEVQDSSLVVQDSS
ncbi:rho guanine nucleotide exchange factor 1-like [Physella acuta]|uniref:rho guanine nucleotide exchange factor 1-like n=1 Tax=Physella acuta TaxID=109671 RepID=UPI0027DB6172|nr:rho guanine nucleotide exchange factor 1-like [Physella acuta]